MADYPATLPTFAANGANLSTAPHSALHTDLNQEVVAIATELGTAPSGTFSTVKARLDSMVVSGRQIFANAAARDAAIPAPTTGQTAFLLDLVAAQMYNGAAWVTEARPTIGALPSWTPTIVQGVTVTKNTTLGIFSRRGRDITATALLAITSAGTASNLITFTLPATAGTDGLVIGDGYVIRGTDFRAGLALSSAGGTVGYLVTIIAGATEPALRIGSGATGGTAALANLDTVMVRLGYTAVADA